MRRHGVAVAIRRDVACEETTSSMSETKGSTATEVTNGSLLRRVSQDTGGSESTEE